jgi:hypothetical protein
MRARRIISTVKKSFLQGREMAAKPLLSRRDGDFGNSSRTIKAMPFRPDIVVKELDSPQILLIVETKLKEDIKSSESQLKRYMWEMSCPLGLLVSPRELFLYKNRFTGYSEDSIQLVGSFSSPRSWASFEKDETSVGAFERTVQGWLEGIRSTSSYTEVPLETKRALADYIAPTLLRGEIRAAGPRTGW